ncbi:hypothetical protein P8452_24152 [Trifolium repens]|uniref:Uncharacterized protein n=1 Tax=Trifolium repens TaxID=3899 RepID=D3YBF9_TRIRP|nr:unknown [Trifolium repens]KAK2446763.1 hypothetical protein QL285_017523 [Trifolium repens]WJX36254.1 hypothetical protein P8452_24152 [Trifolium repens]
MEQEIENMIFNMGSLGTSFSQKRGGLSRYYSGKARSFVCMEDVHSVEDLKKPKHPDAKKRKKQSHRNEFINLNPYPCRRAPSCTQLTTPFVNA